MAASSATSRQRHVASAARKRYGSETPRIFTPPLRKLEPRTAATERRTLGYQVIDFAAEILLIKLLPWQCWLLVHMLELLPDGSPRFRTVIVLVARQNGKSTLSQVLGLWMMYALGTKLVIGTAQDLDVAEEIWQGAVDLVIEEDDDERPVRPELAGLLDRVVNVNGKKALVLTTGERWKVKAANRRAGRSLSGDLILLDELREHQSWDAWGALTKTTMARAQALILALSNAGDAASIVLRYLRQLAITPLVEDGQEDLRDELGEVAIIAAQDDLDDYLADGIEEAEQFANDDSLGIFEWSAGPGCDLADWDAIAQANPALGYMITERAILAARRTDPEWVYRTEVLCQWNSGTAEGVFPAGTWEACLDGKSSIADAGEYVLGVDVSHDRGTTYVAAAARDQDGWPHVEIFTYRAGTHWLVKWLTERRDKITAIAVQGKGAPASELIEGIEDADLPLRRWEGSDLPAGCGQFYDLVRDTGLRRPAQPVLDVAAATAVTKPLGDRFVWDRAKSPADAAPLLAATAAVWALLNAPVPTESVYESRGLEVV